MPNRPIVITAGEAVRDGRAPDAGAADGPGSDRPATWAGAPGGASMARPTVLLDTDLTELKARAAGPDNEWLCGISDNLAGRSLMAGPEIPQLNSLRDSLYRQGADIKCPCFSESKVHFVDGCTDPIAVNTVLLLLMIVCHRRMITPTFNLLLKIYQAF